VSIPLLVLSYLSNYSSSTRRRFGAVLLTCGQNIFGRICGIILIVTLAGCSSAPSNTALGPQSKGRGQFIFEQGGRHVVVRYYVPSGSLEDMPMIIVMHGMLRNGETYLEDWIPYARSYHFLLITPEFSENEFPHDRGYPFGNVRTRSGRPIPSEQWSYSMIEPIFDVVRERTGNRSPRYSIYGHSAGAQFVERFVCMVPQARILRAVCANAGGYMLPDLGRAFPYGFGGTRLGEEGLRTALGRPLVVLLGTADTDAHHKELPHTPETEAQGPNRLARGKYFFAHGEMAATALKTPFSWTLVYAPGVGHSDQGMAEYAIKCLFQN
jgi:poly(3-hydroxybutyrate) depolymerase